MRDLLMSNQNINQQVKVLAGADATGFHVLQGNTLRNILSGEVIEERECCIHVNGKELVTLAATPVMLESLALGFLANEGLLGNMDEVIDVSIRGNGSCVDVWLNHEIKVPKRKVLTSGCTGGVTFGELAARLEPLQIQISASAVELRQAVRQLYDLGNLYRVTRGVHTSILWRDGEVLAAAEDVGRHNTLDKLRGWCMQQGLDTRGSILVSTGRISSEMLTKAVRMSCPIVVSRTSATSMSVHLAREWNVTLIGYFRGNQNNSQAWQMIVYSHPENLILETE
jgi:FdhD protein